MTKRQAVTNDQLQQFLGQHRHWSVLHNKLHRDYVFADFKQAFAFMAKMAAIAESMDHHPAWFNVYNRLSVDLDTHDQQAITMLDIALAQKMEAVFHDR